MNWKTKAFIQRAVAALPEPLSGSLYYRLQQAVGSFNTTPEHHLSRANILLQAILKTGRPLAGSVIEVGTGRTLNIPLGFWLCGFDRIHTVDVNRYLRKELVKKDLAWIRANSQAIRSLLPRIDDDRLQALENIHTLDELLSLSGILYMPGTPAFRLPFKKVDYHISNSVLEHIPIEDLRALLIEARRLGSTCVHRIQLSDHFSHSDPAISALNFLQYSEREWNHYAGNRFMYHNRMRAYEYDELFRSVGLKLEFDQREGDRESEEAAKLLKLGSRFSGRSPQELAVHTMTILAS
jgi:hypothetical protein